MVSTNAVAEVRRNLIILQNFVNFFFEAYIHSVTNEKTNRDTQEAKRSLKVASVLTLLKNDVFFKCN